MCGRYGRWSRRQRIEEVLGIEPSGLDNFTPLYNITPGVNTWVVRAKDGKPTLYSYLWGTRPVLVEGPEEGSQARQRESGVGARKADVPEAHPRAAVPDPANCYYEWKQTPIGKRPICIRMADESPFFLGGMWDVWDASELDALFTFSVLTTFPNEVSATVHDRMPLIGQPKDYARWLDRENEEVADILAPYPSHGMVAYPVSRRVNDPKNDDAKLIEPEPA